MCGCFAWVDVPGGQLPQIIVGGITILPLEQHARRRSGVIHCENDNRSMMADDFPESDNSLRLADTIDNHGVDPAAICDFSRQDFGMLWFEKLT
jgi:hypothetical protein